MSPAAQILVDGYGLDVEGAEPVARAAARLFEASQGYAEHILANLVSAGDEPSPERREAFCAKVAWGVYVQSEPTGGIEGLDRGLPEEAFADRKKRDKVAEEVIRHLDWRKSILEANPGKGPAEILIEGFALEAPAAERLSHVVAKVLRMDERFASAVLDTARQEPDISAAGRESFLGRFAANVYSQHGGKVEGVPGNLGPVAFTRLWIRDLVAVALERKVSAPTPETAPEPGDAESADVPAETQDGAEEAHEDEASAATVAEETRVES